MSLNSPGNRWIPLDVNTLSGVQSQGRRWEEATPDRKGKRQIQDAGLLGGHDFSTKVAAQSCVAPLKRLCETTVPQDGCLGEGGVGLLLLAPSCLQPSIGQNLSHGIATVLYQNEHPGAHRPTSRAASTIAPATSYEMMLFHNYSINDTNNIYITSIFSIYIVPST